MVRIRNNNLQEIIDWHYNEFKTHFLPIFYKQKRYSRNPEEKKILEFLSSKLDVIIKGSPTELQWLIDEVEKFNPVFYRITNYNKKKKRNVKKPTRLLNVIQKAFDYTKFCNNKNNDWNAYRLAEKLKISACPYCNRQFTHTVFLDNSQAKENDKRILRHDFDHFFDKATYPFLALSFFNLIPSCQNCNSRMKGSMKFDISQFLHPYLDEFGDLVKFSLRIKDSSFFYGNTKSAEIYFVFNDSPDKKLIEKAKNNIEVFKLDKLYQEHLDYVFELVNKAIVFNDAYLNELYRRFEGRSLFRNKEDLIRLISGNYVGLEDLQQRPLSKLTRDISEQFNLW